MLVLTVNAGSSSLRAHLVDTTDEHVVDAAESGHPADSEAAQRELDDLLERVPTEAISAIGHRLVHGGPHLLAPAVVDDQVLATLREVAPIAPQHVPAALALLESLHRKMPECRQIVCPDTAFHSGLPAAARTYPLPRRWREEWGLRRYGFHGLSFAWALRRTAELLGRPAGELDVLLAHLSGGCSVAAVHKGRSVDTSMGFTPLEGLAMSKRSGSVDPGMLLWLLREKKLSLDELETGLQSESGLLGLSGSSPDTRDLVRAAERGDEAAALAMDVFCHRVRRELAAAATSLERVDALVFTGDIGWDQPEVAESVSAGLGVLGVRGGLATRRTEDAVISGPDAGVPVLTVQSREELQLAAETAAVAARPRT
ncbi:acetate/propionate family kinase [Amycolatopsis anabasis]|uniref:acetate/propionate family kinase n=1 Tax=Amycolatopsis anabasis TaxID=1840409 RepID=UPI00131C2012|nr:acetate/propionate family kinase [Amycolatopsis anabasis]